MKDKIKLTNGNVDKLKFPVGAQSKTGRPLDYFIAWDTDEPGFGVRLSSTSDRKVYVYKRRVRGTRTERNFSLGRHGDPVLLPDGSVRTYPFGADDGRRQARRLLAQLQDGIDPVEEERKAQEAAGKAEEEAKRKAEQDAALATTLRQVLEHFLTHHTTKNGPLRPATQKDYRYHCDKNFEDWLDRPVAGITRDMCLAKFSEITARGAKIQANLSMAYLRSLLNHARELHFDASTGMYQILPTNPVSSMVKLIKHMNPTVERESRIPLDRVGQVWALLQQHRVSARRVDQRTAADWVCFMMLTGTRRSESRSLKWTDVDLDARTVTLHADVTKTHAKLVIPMSNVLHDILEARRQPTTETKAALRRRVERHSDEYVFASGGKKKPYIDNAAALFELISAAAGTPINRHDLRRTFEDIASEVGIDWDQRRLLINHKSGDVHSRHYANNRRNLASATQLIAQWIANQGKIAEAQESGANVLRFPTRGELNA
jgi:integrase